MGLWVLLLLSGAPKQTCSETCTAQMTQCTERCGSASSCVDRCERRLKPCADRCVALEEKAEAAASKRKLPCGKVDGKIVFCSDDEEKQLRQSLDKLPPSLKLCKDDEGALVECPTKQ